MDFIAAELRHAGSLGLSVETPTLPYLEPYIPSQYSNRFCPPSPISSPDRSAQPTLMPEWTHSNYLNISPPSVALPSLMCQTPVSSVGSFPSSPLSPLSLTGVDGGPIFVPRRPTRSRRGPNHIPRPRNAFFIFRSWMTDRKVIPKAVEMDNRHLSRTIAMVWEKMDPLEKAQFKLLAAQEKEEHQRKYPEYRFRPQARTKKPAKRHVRRNGPEDEARCVQLSNLVSDGMSGQLLQSEIQKFDQQQKQTMGAPQATIEPCSVPASDPVTPPSPPSFSRWSSLADSCMSSYGPSPSELAPLFESDYETPTDMPFLSSVSSLSVDLNSALFTPDGFADTYFATSFLGQSPF
ncbi:unnamed protein product [Mycena citricolor]|uniref:HMG box domain-containing protein n=1 Tax=Mycena citricolor TaxID=2018698 RepID=A0AAD2HS05_9AGAR|nr:unnamed protein product [Mycena citricolor]